MTLGILLSTLVSWLLLYVLGYLLSLLFFDQMVFVRRVLLSFGLGFGAASLLMAVLGMIFNFGIVPLAASYVLLIAILVKVNCKKFEDCTAEWNISKVLVELESEDLIVLFVLIVFIGTSLTHIQWFPDLYEDASIYSHWARTMYQNKTISFIEGGPTIGLGLASNYPSSYQVVSSFIFYFTGESTLPIRYTSLLFASLLSVLTIHWTNEHFKKKRYSLFTILIFLSLPFMIVFSRTSSHYMYLVFNFSMASYYLYGYTKEREKTSLYLSAIFAAFAASTSYLGLTLGLLFLTVAFFERFKLDHIVLFVLIMAAVAFPWYLKNLITLGNPFWPFGGGKFIDSNIQKVTNDQLEQMGSFSGFDYSSAGKLKNSVYRLLFSYVSLEDSRFSHILNPYFTLFAVPAVALWSVSEKRDKKLTFFIYWFFVILGFYILPSSYWNRYLSPLAVPTVFLSVWILSQLFERLEKNRRLHYLIARNSVYFVLSVIFLFSLLLSLFWTECKSGSLSAARQYMGNEQHILEICYDDEYQMWSWANNNLPSDAKVATTDYLNLYYYENPVIELNSWHLRDLFYSNSIEESVDILKENGVRYVAVKTETADFLASPRYFGLLASMGNNAVFAVR